MAKEKKVVERTAIVEQKQTPMFEGLEAWKEEWVGMPEFVQEKAEPFATIIVRFSSQEDLDDFARRIDQKLTPKTKSIWHPELVRGFHGGRRWGSES
jgi:hypothetical protein